LHPKSKNKVFLSFSLFFISSLQYIIHNELIILILLYYYSNTPLSLCQQYHTLPTTNDLCI
jgi:hypothetical protein